MSTTPSLKALHDASPRNQPEFDALLERYEELGTQITSSPPDSAGRPRRPAHRRRLISLSLGFAAAAALAVVRRRPDARRRIAAECVCGRAQGARRHVGPAFRHDDAHGERGDALHPALERSPDRAQEGPVQPAGARTRARPEPADAVDRGRRVRARHRTGRGRTTPARPTWATSSAPKWRASPPRRTQTTHSRSSRSPATSTKTSGPNGTTMYTGTIRNAHVDPQMTLSQNDVTQDARQAARRRRERRQRPRRDVSGQLEAEDRSSATTAW